MSPDGKYLLYAKTDKAMKAMNTLQLYSFADKKITPFGAISSAALTCATFSPDGRWVAYTTSSATGTGLRVYVQPFPTNGTTYEISTGIHPMWSRDGKRLFFGPGQGRFASVSLSTQPTFTFGNPVSVSRSLIELGPNVQRPYDIAPDGKFVGVVTVGATEGSVAVASRVEVVLNWFDELKQRVPVK